MGYIGLYCNRFIALITQIIHEQTNRKDKTFLILQFFEKYSSTGQQLAYIQGLASSEQAGRVTDEEGEKVGDGRAEGSTIGDRTSCSFTKA